MKKILAILILFISLFGCSKESITGPDTTYRPSTTIVFEVARESFVTLEMYDIKSLKIRTLANDYYAAGRQHVVWDGEDDKGRTVDSGMYYCRLQIETYESWIKIPMIIYTRR